MLQFYDLRKIFLINQQKKLKISDNTQKTTTGQGDDCITGCLLDNPYFQKRYKMIELDLSKQQKLGADPKAIHQFNFEKINQPGNITMLLEQYFRLFTRI